MKTKKKAIASITAATIIASIVTALPVNLDGGLSEAHAAPLSELNSQKSDLKSQLATLQTELETASDSYDTALDEQHKAEQSLSDTNQQLSDVEKKISDTQAKINTRCADMYRNNEKNRFVSLILGATNLQDMLSAIESMSTINSHDAATIAESKQLQEQLAAKQNEAQQAKATAEQKTAEAEQIKNDAQSKVDEYQNKINSVDASIRQQVLAEAQEAASKAATDSPSVTTESTSIPSNGSVLEYAKSRLGCPYVWGASGPSSFDCSGLTMWCYAQVGISIPHNSESQKAAARAVIPVSEAQPGDILYRPGHVGICLSAGGGSYIHAPTPGDVVKVSSYGGWSCALRY